MASVPYKVISEIWIFNEGEAQSLQQADDD